MNTNTPKVAHVAPIETPFVLGNRALRAGDYDAAINYYLIARQAMPALDKIIAGNLAIARQKYEAAREISEHQSVMLSDANLPEVSTADKTIQNQLVAKSINHKINGVDPLTFPDRSMSTQVNIRHSDLKRTEEYGASCKNKDSITVLITSHNEGSLFKPTLRSAEAACDHAETHGLITKILVILDYASLQTESIATAFKKNSKISVDLHKTEFGCPAASRNFGISLIKSEFVAIQDADDLMSVNWLIDAVNKIKIHSSQEIVIHPQWNISFGRENLLMQHPCMLKDENIYYGNLFFENYWTALCIAKKSIFDRIQYTSNKGSKIFGYEDWEWNLKCIEANILHVTAVNTFHFIRKKDTGVSHIERGGSRIVRPTGFLKSRRFLDSVLFQSNHGASLNQCDEASFDEECYLICNPDVAEGVNNGIFKSGLQHYKNSGKKERRNTYPYGLLKQLKDICKFDYALFPDKSLLLNYRYYIPNKVIQKADQAVKVFRDLNLKLMIKTIDSQFDCVLVAPWILKGGADLALLFHLKYLVNENKRVLLILTECRSSPWLSRVPNGITIHNIGELAPQANRDEKKVLLFYVLATLKTKVLHIINSQAAWDVLITYGEIIHSSMKVIISLYCYDYSDEGKPVGYPDSLQNCSEWIDLIYSDNIFFVKHLNEHYGIDFHKMIVLNHPIDFIYGDVDFYDSSSSNILWASRLDQQKRPDILLEVAKACPDFKFYVFGSSMLDESDVLFKLQALDNVELMGSFDGFLSLSRNKYFAFLYTSQWDGLPNILLEAAACGLPIVAPAIGGITDFLSVDRGFLCHNTSAIDDYVGYLNKLYGDKNIAREIKVCMGNYLVKKHTYELFFEQLRLSGY